MLLDLMSTVSDDCAVSLSHILCLLTAASHYESSPYQALGFQFSKYKLKAYVCPTCIGCAELAQTQGKGLKGQWDANCPSWCLEIKIQGFVDFY